MTELSITTGAAGRRARGMTPAGIQSQRQLLLRRLLYVLLVCVTCAVLAYGIALALGLNRTGASLPESAIFVLSLLGLPWFATGLWNALIGLWLLHGKRDGLHKAAPYLRAAETSTPLRLRVALIMTIRNEDPRRAFARFSAVRDDLVATGEASLIDYFVLSDTSDEQIANMEQAHCDDWNVRSRGGKLIYRRREVNADFKAGNIRDFLERWGESYDLMLPLDADSVMSGDAIVRLIRVMQAYPKLGILQSLTVGTPAQSAFARLFQFGMRHSMRSYTMGGAWWSGDCGPYWGHNALIRVRPFRDHCELPVLPGKPPLGGSILSHDQLEAALMRRAGYEVRVVPVEGGSYEDNPPALLEFAKRDVRWCQGNMQYWPFITWPGLKMVSCVQIALAILMYLGSAATTVSIGLALIIAASGGFKNVDREAATIVLALIYIISLVPKLAGLADVALTKGGTGKYGGSARLGLGAASEIVFSWVMGVIITLRSTVFMASLLFRRTVSWGGQVRDAHGLSWRDAAFSLWPETLTGAALFLAMRISAPQTLVWAMPIIAALGLSIPFAVLTSSPRFGRLLASWGLCGIPEEFERTGILARLQVPVKKGEQPFTPPAHGPVPLAVEEEALAQ